MMIVVFHVLDSGKVVTATCMQGGKQRDMDHWTGLLPEVNDKMNYLINININYN